MIQTRVNGEPHGSKCDAALSTYSAQIGPKETQICFKMQKDGEPVWDQTIDRLWVTTQTEALIKSGPPPAANAQPSNASEQKAKKDETKK